MAQEIPQVGKLCEPTAGRDAIHVAIAPVVAGCWLKPGWRVGLNEAGQAVSGTMVKHLGIVDPFLEDEWIETGKRFFLFLFPGTITSLRHVWSHPDFNTNRIFRDWGETLKKLADS